MRIVQGIKGKSLSGHDEIPMFVLKKFIHIISESSVHSISCSLTERIFPTSLKKGIMKAGYNRGNPNDISNFRPISLLTSFNKIGKIPANRSLSFFSEFSIFSNNQHGFLPGRGTTTPI